MLLSDKYRPQSLDDMDYHKEISSSLKNLVQMNDFPHILFFGPSGAGKKTRVLALLREIFGPGVDKMKLDNKSLKLENKSTSVDISIISSPYHVELTPSDSDHNDRHVIQHVIKDLAQNVTMETSANSKPFKVVVLNEVDTMTKEAQQALRRTMEKYVSNCRLIMITERISKVIEAVKSRCLCIRVGAPDSSTIKGILMDVAKKEGFSIPESLTDKIIAKAERNLRRALLIMQSTRMKSSNSNELDPNTPIELPEWETFVSQIANLTMEQQSPQQLMKVREKLYELLGHCIPPHMIFKKLSLALMEKADTELQFEIVKWATFYEHRAQIGTKPMFHIEAFVAKFMYLYKSFLIKNYGA